MPSRPANGARTTFLAMTARMLSTWAFACFQVASVCSRSDCAMARCAIRRLARSNARRARSAPASAARSWLCSTSSSSSTSSSPAFTTDPAANRILRTTPSASVLTWVPCTATTEPTDDTRDSQCCRATATELTRSAGETWFANASPIAANCSALIPAMLPTITTTAAMPAAAVFPFGVFTRSLLQRGSNTRKTIQRLVDRQFRGKKDFVAARRTPAGARSPRRRGRRPGHVAPRLRGRAALEYRPAGMLAAAIRRGRRSPFRESRDDDVDVGQRALGRAGARPGPLHELDLVAIGIVHVQRRAAAPAKDVVGLAAVARDLDAEVPHYLAYLLEVRHDERPAPAPASTPGCLVGRLATRPQPDFGPSARREQQLAGTDSGQRRGPPESEHSAIELHRPGKVAHRHHEPLEVAARRVGHVHAGRVGDGVHGNHG